MRLYLYGYISYNEFEHLHILDYLERLEAEVGAFYWTVLTPDIVKLGREEQGSVSV